MSHVRFFFCACVPHSFASILYLILLSSSPTLPACLPSPRRWTTSKYCWNRWSIESLKIVISGDTITFIVPPYPSLSLPLTHVLLFLFFLRLRITMWSSRIWSPRIWSAMDETLLFASFMFSWHSGDTQQFSSFNYSSACILLLPVLFLAPSHFHSYFSSRSRVDILTPFK